MNTGLNMAREVAALKRMTVKELRGRYVDVFGEATRSGNKDWLWKRLAWRIQANLEGDLSERARRFARHRIRHSSGTQCGTATVAWPGSTRQRDTADSENTRIFIWDLQRLAEWCR